MTDEKFLSYLHKYILFHSDGGMTKEWSANPLEISLRPRTRARAKRFKEALNILIQDA